jgi:hypothetical protein
LVVCSVAERTIGKGWEETVWVEWRGEQTVRNHVLLIDT